MKLEKFKTILEKIQAHEDQIMKINQMGVDLFGLYDNLLSVVSLFWEEIYNEEGLDWINWFTYDNEMGKKNLEAKNKKGNPICFDVVSLHKYIEKHCKK